MSHSLHTSGHASMHVHHIMHGSGWLFELLLGLVQSIWTGMAPVNSSGICWFVAVARLTVLFLFLLSLGGKTTRFLATFLGAAGSLAFCSSSMTCAGSSGTCNDASTIWTAQLLQTHSHWRRERKEGYIRRHRRKDCSEGYRHTVIGERNVKRDRDTQHLTRKCEETDKDTVI